MYIESTNSRSKITSEVENTTYLLPEFLRESSEGLINFLKDYYRYMNEEGQASAEISSINRYRDLDNTVDKYLDELAKEIGPTLPDTFTPDRIKLFKRLVEWYVARGSIESIELFFRIVFSEAVQVYYPWEDMFTPSDGDWQEGSSLYLGEKNTVSNYNRLQDSYFYQRYSYAIRTEYPIEEWGKTFNRLVHPAGFIFFGDVLIDLGPNVNVTPYTQPSEDPIDTLLIKIFFNISPDRTLDDISQYTYQTIDVYSKMTITEGINNLITDKRIGSTITILS